MAHPYDPPRYAVLDATLSYAVTTLALVAIVYMAWTTLLWAREARHSPEIQVRDPKLTVANTGVALAMAGISAFDGLHPIMHRTLLGGYLLNLLTCLYLVGLMFRTMRLLRLYNLNRSRLSAAYTQAMIMGGGDAQAPIPADAAAAAATAAAAKESMDAANADGSRASAERAGSPVQPPHVHRAAAAIASPVPARRGMQSLILQEPVQYASYGSSLLGQRHSPLKTAAALTAEESIIAPWTPPATPPPRAPSQLHNLHHSQQQQQQLLQLMHPPASASSCSSGAATTSTTTAAAALAMAQAQSLSLSMPPPVAREPHAKAGARAVSPSVPRVSGEGTAQSRWQSWKRRLRSDIFESVSITKFTLQRRYLWIAYGVTIAVNVAQIAGTVTRYDWYSASIETCMIIYCSGAAFLLLFMPLVVMQLVRLRSVKDLYHVRSDCLFLCSFMIVTFIISLGLAIGLPYEWRYNQHIFFIMSTNAFMSHHLGVALPMIRARRRRHETGHLGFSLATIRHCVSCSASALSADKGGACARHAGRDGASGSARMLELGYSIASLESCLGDPRYMFALKMRAAKSLCIENILFIEDWARLWRPPQEPPAADADELPPSPLHEQQQQQQQGQPHTSATALLGESDAETDEDQYYREYLYGVPHIALNSSPSLCAGADPLDVRAFGSLSNSRSSRDDSTRFTTLDTRAISASSGLGSGATLARPDTRARMVVPAEHREAYRQLFRDYLTASSELELNVPSEYRKEAEAALTRPDGVIYCDVFDRVRGQCMANIFSGPYLDFVKSEKDPVNHR